MNIIYEKRLEYWRARDAAARLRRELREMEAEAAREKLTRLSPHQRLVLECLATFHTDRWSEYTYYYGYSSICGGCNLNRRQARRAILALRRLGFVEYAKGLSTEDGELAGSGFRATQAGYDWWRTKEAGL